MIPDSAYGDSRTRVLLAVTWLRRPTVRRVAEEVGLNVSNTHRHLEALRADGLVTWEDYKQGTLRALVEEWWF